jgi:3-hydroxyisobutyrate dehydrogenase
MHQRKKSYWTFIPKINVWSATAEAGALAFMVGAAQQLFETVTPVLAATGRNIVHCGESGNG